MKQSWVVATSVFGLLAGIAAGTASIGAGEVDQDRRGVRSAEVLLGAAEDRLPSNTPADWVTYADHVLVLTPTHETAVIELPSETGGGLIRT